MKIIYNGLWLDVETEHGKFFIIYDSGQIASKEVIMDIDITPITKSMIK